MKRRTLPARLLLLGLGGATLVGACDSELALILAGKRCRVGDGPACLEGFVCIEGFCRVPGEVVPEPDDGGVAAGGAGNVVDAGRDGSDVTGGTGGTLTLDGEGSQGGTGPVVDIPDASIILDGGPDGCVPVDLYRDRDGDGVGDTARHAWGCIRDGWVEAFGDCRDDQEDVFPGQTTTFAMGYPDPAKPDGVSFDYDCNGAEVGASDNDPKVAEPACQGLSLLLCNGRGYQASTRSGDGVNPLCGSETLVTCGADTQTGLNCVPFVNTVQQRFRCN